MMLLLGRAAAVAPGGHSAQLLVRLRPGADIAAVARGKPVQIARALPEIGRYVVRVTRGPVAEARQRLLADARVLAVEEDRHVHAAQEPNDPQFVRQWALQAIQAPFAWELEQGSTSVVVAILDSGVDFTHPDLAAHLRSPGCNVIADGICPPAGRGTPAQDLDGHGTAVAGIVAAVTNNGFGIAGTAWQASILPVRVLSNGQGVESDFITGLLWAVDQGAKVINLSFNEDCGVPESAAMRDAIGYAWAHGAVLIAASGNDSGCSDGVYPAADPRVLAVASTDMDDHPSSFSNGGPWVRIAAPGEKILTTTTDGRYVIVSGTSYAAPFVAGVAALLMAVPGATNTNVVRWLTSTCDVPPGWDAKNYGCGRLNAYRAVVLALHGSDPHTSSTAPVTVHLARGWNNILYLGPPRRVMTALASLQGKLGSVYTWDAVQGEWLAYLPGQPAASDIQILVERQAYWLYMNAPADLTMQPTGNDPPVQLTLAPGWNNVGLPAGPLPIPLQRFSRPIGAVWTWDPDNSAWQGFFVGAGAVSTLQSIQAMAAYWVYAPTAVTIRFAP